MGALGHYATLVEQLGPSHAARAVARRANRALRVTLYGGAHPWTVRRLLSSLGKAPREAAGHLFESAHPLWCDGSRRDEVVAALGRVPGARERAHARAEKAAQRSFDVFGTQVHFGPHAPIDWSLDAASGMRYPRAPALELSLFTPGLDPKFPWALGRLEQLVALGQGAWVSGEEVYRRQFAAQAHAFVRANPMGVGIQWACPMEVALRAANLAMAMRMFSGAGMAVDEALELFCALLDHCAFVEVHLEDGNVVPNNHLVAGYLGLLLVSLAFPHLPGATRRTQLAARGLSAQMQAQVHEDGFSFEGSVPYHRLATEMFALAHLAARTNGVDLGSSFAGRLKRMFFAVEGYCSEGGRAPQIGDNDSGRVLALCDRDDLSHGYLASLGAALFDEPALKREGAPPPDELAWLCGAEGVQRWGALSCAARRRPFSSRAGGLYVLHGGGLTVAVRAGPNGQRGLGGHSHNDHLSFELHVDGEPVIVDLGTGSYTRDPTLRNELRATAAHNTPQVDREEIWPFDPARPFALPEGASCEARLSADAHTDRLVAFHRGYERLADPVWIERCLTLHKEKRALTVVDRFEGAKRHDLRSRLHAPDGELQLRAATQDELHRAGALEEGLDELQPWVATFGRVVVLFSAGWNVRVTGARYSPAYGVTRPAACLLAQRTGHLPERLTWVILATAPAPSGRGLG
ncbi:MAG: alginate lyase family protein [Myxococcota bacterium]